MTTHETPASAEVCPMCGDVMTDTHDNYRPTWSDTADDVVCWWCAWNGGK